MNNILRKTHPMVLVAAVALTIFSLLGSAAITGLIPSAYSQKQDAVQSLSDSPTDAKSNDDMSRNSGQFKSKPAKTNSMPANGKANSEPAGVAACANCGTIVSIHAVESEGDATGLGAVAGGVAGGVVGNQIGKGKGNVLMTVLGIGGGAYAGHTIEKKMKSHTAYLIKVHMNDGSYRTVTQYSEPQHAVGDQVKLNSGQLVSA
ncbi:MAG TPA: glycine zipper 2TM domain-containing protein [Methylophilaceae bacterium]|jgi:outer membrane lipoprotein SlyB